MRSRANSFTACTARNRFTFFLRAILCVPQLSCCHSFDRSEHAIIVFRRLGRRLVLVKRFCSAND